MELGVALPQFGRHASGEAIARIATEAERLGYDSLWVQERLLRPVAPRTGYGGMPGPWPEPYRSVFDPIETLTYAAALTQRVKLGTSVLVAPYHTPVVLGKRLASLDQLSQGRVIAGLGLGWAEDEYEASNVSFQRRGARLEEFVAALRALWGPDPVEFSGQFYRLSRSQVGPKPVQQPHPPILLAGFAPRAIARAGRVADGFNTIGVNLPFLQQLVDGYRAAAAQAGRRPGMIVVRTNGSVTDQPIGGERQAFTGSAEQVAEDVRATAAMGVQHIFFDFNFVETPIDDQVRYLERLRKLIPKKV